MLKETDLTPIHQAVEPLRAAAMDRAEQKAREIIARVTADLEAAGWDVHVVAPYPRSTGMGRVAFQIEVSKYRLYRTFVRHASGSRHLHDPELVSIDQDRAEKFVADARADASLQYDKFICKLNGKCGPVRSASLSGSHVWGYSHLTVETEAGETQVWRTQMIVNQSKLGTVFNQFPTRRVKH